jgi:hypothetical protein
MRELTPDPSLKREGRRRFDYMRYTWRIGPKKVLT